MVFFYQIQLVVFYPFQPKNHQVENAHSAQGVYGRVDFEQEGEDQGRRLLGQSQQLGGSHTLPETHYDEAGILCRSGLTGYVYSQRHRIYYNRDTVLFGWDPFVSFSEAVGAWLNKTDSGSVADDKKHRENDWKRMIGFTCALLGGSKKNVYGSYFGHQILFGILFPGKTFPHLHGVNNQPAEWTTYDWVVQELGVGVNFSRGCRW